MLFACSAIFALSPDFSAVSSAVISDDDDEDEESGEESEDAEESESEEESRNQSEEDNSDFEEKTEDDPFSEKKKADDDPFSEPKKTEEDPFATSKPSKQKDDFVQGGSQSLYPDPEEDDFVVEKREKGVVHRHKEPDLAKVVTSTYLYTEASVRSKKLFELYEKDDLVVLEEANDFYRVEFLGKEGWVPKDDVRLEKWYTYRLSIELAGGIGGGGGDFKNFDIIGNYTLKLNVAALQDLVVGVEGRALSLDTDNLYYGGGILLRYYIHGLRTRKTRSAITASAGFIGGIEKIADRTRPNGILSFFGGPYASASLDYFFRVWEYIALGVGGDFTYLKMYGSFKGFDRSEQLFQGGGHLSIMFNVMR